MRIVVCVKEVLDPDAVNNYAVAGRLVIGEDGKTLTQTAIPRLMNGFDEQGIEAALRLRDAGVDCTIAVISAGPDPDKMLKHAGALGANELVAISVDPVSLDYHVVGSLLAAQIRASGGADLVLCGRQASDDDQGVIPALLGEKLSMPVVTFARAVEMADGGALRVTRVTPEGDEVIEVSCPAVVTVSNELGDPRYPTAANKMKARRMKPTAVSVDDLGLSPEELQPKVSLARQFVPTIEGDCEIISGGTQAEAADRLIERLREESVLE